MTDPKENSPQKPPQPKPQAVPDKPLSEQIKNAHASGDGSIRRPDGGKEEDDALPE